MQGFRDSGAGPQALAYPDCWNDIRGIAGLQEQPPVVAADTEMVSLE